ncbi:UDP-3-O-(3-hydroxymyristoyl)glucosamine N-acyltransferase [Ghiorsea bivora]|uniref:UDP-3-O-(3-hydroxymyristoyl)glucosamine N-acyltransferase n=1 Tax=Ghiorsea bivora TaxID=1485545 RepID=UPI00068D947D|nr:UDP-3-O-(3-hydroxymyristoyl)glucosamine N-acyltransferase [Ghiorsea bivora]
MSITPLTLAEVAELLGGELICNDSSIVIAGVQTLAKAKANQASFLSNMKYKNDLQSTQAGLVLLGQDIELPAKNSFAVIRLYNPYVGFTKLQQYFHPAPVSTGVVHASASVHDKANLAAQVQLDAFVSIAEDVSVGAGSIIGSGCVLEKGVRIGENCLLHPRVVLAQGTTLGDRVIVQAGAVIGSDGFGFAWTGEDYLKIPQVGHVVIENDVEIGANTCIDRGAIGNTVIKQGAKLDNLIQLAHNVEVGEHTVIAGQAGFAGSTVIGKGCQFGAQSGVAGHLKLVDGTIVGAKAGVIGDIKEKGMVSGFPAVPHRHWLKASALFDRLPAIWNKIKRLS